LFITLFLPKDCHLAARSEATAESGRSARNCSGKADRESNTVLPARNSPHGNSVNVTFVDATFVKEYRITIYFDLVTVGPETEAEDSSMKSRSMSDAVIEAGMVRHSKAANPVERHWSPEAAGANGGARPGTATENTSPLPGSVAACPATAASALSIRAENVLKELAAELIGEHPPKGRWIPPEKLLRKLTFAQLQTTRNCGPQTTAEIVAWAGLRGVVIRPPLHAGKSLPVMWRDLVARFSSGESTRAEIAEALQRSARRNNTRIPVAFQELLLTLLNSTGKQP
jgi:prepilin-type processing-associated H-X9-DG protein